jgi:hypothetical protein
VALQILILAVGGTETVGKLPDGGRAFQDVPGWPIWMETSSAPWQVSPFYRKRTIYFCTDYE